MKTKENGKNPKTTIKTPINSDQVPFTDTPNLQIHKLLVNLIKPGGTIFLTYMTKFSSSLVDHEPQHLKKNQIRKKNSKDLEKIDSERTK